MKKVLSVIIIFSIAFCCSAQNTVTHIVQRAETIESIANKYGISVADIQKANPDVKNYFYVGMQLSIPSKTVSKTPENTQSQNEQSNQPILSQSQQSQLSFVPTTTDKGNNGESRVGTGTFVGEMSMLNLQTNLPSTFKSNWGSHIALGYRYFLHNNIFAEGFFGWQQHVNWEKGTGGGDYTIHYLILPIHAGVFYPLSENWGVGFLIGPRIFFPISAKYNVGKSSEKIETETVVGLDLGIDIAYKEYCFRPVFNIGLGSNNKTQMIMLGLSFRSGF